MRYWGGNCLMDKKSTSGPLFRETQETLNYCNELAEEWHNRTRLIQYAISPRFAISCSEKMLQSAVKFRKRYGVLLHTHASESRGEIEVVRQRTGLRNVEYLKKLGLLGEGTVIAHGIHLSESEIRALVATQTGVTHCPSSNLKLASGVARISYYLQKGMKVALGSDGAACNNSMDAFMEMRLAALLQKPLVGPTALPAKQAFELGTLGGAQVLGAQNEIGSLTVGKRADVVIVRRDHPGVATVADPYSALVYSCSGRDVRDVWIDGVCRVREGRHRVYDAKAVIGGAREELERLLSRVSRPLSPPQMKALKQAPRKRRR
jgi:5-methylthioadenosine/S-adenosylhomocysteine deaminase